MRKKQSIIEVVIKPYKFLQNIRLYLMRPKG